MNTYKKLLIGLLFGIGFANAHAFSLIDHERVTSQAIAEFDQCFAGHLNKWDHLVLIGANLDEDTNLIRKDLIYAHFFNPFHAVKMFRRNSSDRVKSLELRIEYATSQNWSRPNILVSLGHAMHQIQDMAVPPHVLPVMHNFTDGFEKYSVMGDISSQWSCADIAEQAANQDLNEMLRASAKLTLQNVDSFHFKAFVSSEQKNSIPEWIELGGNAYWIGTSENKFGRYGFLGNRFGQSEIERDGKSYSVPIQYFQEFKRSQLRQAVQASLKVMYWQMALDSARKSIE